MASARNGFLRLGGAGMRGVVGAGLDPLRAVDYASALGTYLDGGTVVVAHDTRRSSPPLVLAAEAALLACGCDVLHLGAAPAPLAHFAVRDADASGGLLIGAGHHPAGWNALVPLSGNGACFNAVETQSMLDIFHAGIFRRAPHTELGRLSEPASPPEGRYIEAILAPLDAEAIRDARFRVVADFCNGSGSATARRLAEALGVELIALNDEFSGYLPHEPEPRPRAAKQAQALMRHLKADAGFVFNSDASRVSIVADDFETLSEEITCPLVAWHILERRRGGRVVTNVCSSRRLDDIAAAFGAELVKVEVGQAPVVDAMLESAACLAGDGSGSVAFPNGVNGFDALATMAAVLEAMAVRRMTVSALVRKLPSYHIVKRKLPCGGMSMRGVSRIKASFGAGAEIDETDGLRFDWPFGWAHLRISLTEPVVRVIVECDTRARAEELAEEAAKAVEGAVRHA